jgi:hypothetical protein
LRTAFSSPEHLLFLCCKSALPLQH